MRQPIQDIVRAVSETLFEKVLPDLEPASWTASNIRACAMLLVYVEDRIRTETPILLETNALMRGLLIDVTEGRLPVTLDATLGAALEQALGRGEGPSGATEIDGLAMENDAYKECLSLLSRHTAAARTRPDAPDDAAFRARLHDVLRIVQEREVTLAIRANQHIPL
jgi:hypothetical protein